MKIDEKMKQLEEIQDWFMGEDFKLDEAVSRYKKAMELSKEIREGVEKMTNEVEVLGE